MIVWLWAGFILFVFVMLALDLFVVNRKPHVIHTGEALRWTGVCIALALAFSVAVYYMYETNWLGVAGEPDPANPNRGMDAATRFLTGWLVEYSLSLDNIFVIAVIFSHFRIPPRYQHRVLFWGILGALVLRGVMIGAGSALVANFEWVLYIFGAVLIFTGIRLLRQKESEMHPEQGVVFRWASRVFPIARDYEGDRFFIIRDGKRLATMLFIVLLVVETTDVVFAVDSIPAIFVITTDPFIVFTSNVFAIIGLRSLYFALASLMDKFEYLRFSLALILAFVGVKMLVKMAHVEIGPVITLAVIVTALAGGIGTSLVLGRAKRQGVPAIPEEPGE